MILDLIATAVFVSVVLTAVVLVWRKLPVAGAIAAGEPVCLACQIPAGLLAADSFICPACRRDVRVLGIGLVRPRGFAAPFWRLVNYSVGLCAVGLIASALVTANLPTVDYVSALSNTQVEGEPYENLDINVTGRRTGNGPLEGELSADLYLNNGELVTLVVQCPGLRYRVIDTRGHESQWSDEPLSQEAVLSWLAAGGMDVADPQIRRQAPWMLRKLESGLAGMPDASFGEATTLQPRYFRGGTSSTSSSGPLPQAVPLCVIAWSLIWLAGMWLILRQATLTPGGGPA
ncbi:MAG TPA: hypothetical protein VK797_03015 [Tepidisphaeraceae bacterium]|nr:hypothetical protein [Tepidisphaeraceae bacterium]